MNIRFVLRIIILSGVGVGFGYHLYYTKYGIKAYQKLCLELDETIQQQEHLKRIIAEREQTLHIWQTDTFVKEKVAREDLLYSCTNEYVYLIPRAKT